MYKKRVVYYGATPPYPSPSHPAEGDDSSRVPLCHAFGGYTQRGRDVGEIGIGVAAIDQHDNAFARYGEDESHVRACMVYHMSI
jgi:hypothetical protein